MSDITERRRSRAVIEHFYLLRSPDHPANPSTSSSTAYLYGWREGVSADFSNSLPLELVFGNRYEGKPLATLSVLGDVGIISICGEAQTVIQISRRGRFVFLTEAATRQIFSVAPRDYDAGNSFAATRTSAAAWEMFELKDAPAPEGVTESCFDLLAAGAHGIVDAFLGGGASPGLLRCAVNAVSAPELASAIRATDETVLVFRALREWVGKDLPYTIALLDNVLSPEGEPFSIGDSMDWLSSSTIASADRILNDAIRLCLAKEVKSCVVATARNEGVYLLEWIAYQRLLGFDRIVIYTNNNTDGSLGLLHELHRSGVITLIESQVSPGADAQTKAYRHAARLLPQAISAEWCAFLDIDEFIVLNEDRFRTLDDYLEWAARKGGDAIAMTWSLAETTTAVQDWINVPVLQRLTRSSSMQAPLIKCFSRPELIDVSGPHYPMASNGLAMRMSNGDGKRHLWETRPDMPTDPTRAVRAAKDACHLYHFELRTLAEMIWKYSRNRGNYALQGDDLQINGEFPGRLRHFRSCFPNARSSTLPFASVMTDLHQEMDYLRTLGKVSSTEEQMKTVTAARLQKLLSRLPMYLASDEARAIDSESRVMLEAVVEAYGADARVR